MIMEVQSQFVVLRLSFPIESTGILRELYISKTCPLLIDAKPTGTPFRKTPIKA